jgi:hypothetical protein
VRIFRPQYPRAVALQPVVEHCGVDLPKVDLEFDVSVVEIRGLEARMFTDDSALEFWAGDEQA